MMFWTIRRTLVFTLFGVLGTSAFAGDSWRQFRGEAGDGIARDAELPVSIDQSTVKWEVDIHGKGWSSPVVSGDQIWLTTATDDGTTMSAICVDRRSGKIVHDQVVKQNKEPRFCHATNSYASCTPVIDGSRVYVHFGSYLTACLDRQTGDVIWKREDLTCDHFRGPASSPILHDGKLIVAFDGVDARYVLAFDSQTGETVWRTDRDIDYETDNPDFMKAYGTGHVFKVDGQEQLVYPSAVETIAYDPQTGRVQWRVKHGGMNASARPVMNKGMLFLSNGMGSMVAVEPQAVKQGTTSTLPVVWNSRKAVSRKASLLIFDDILYMNSDDGILSARDTSDGKILWRKRAGGAYAASPIMAGDHLYFFSIEGDITTVKPGSRLDIVARTQLGDGFMASPAVVGNELILRSKTKLYCVGSDADDSKR